MKDLVSRLCDYLIETYGDIGFVNPAVFANALRIVGQIPDDATPLFIEQWIGTFTTVRINRAHESVPGWNYRNDAGRAVIETGRNRSPEERNLTLVHEFGETLRSEFNSELQRRWLPQLQWEERFWDGLAVEIVAPLAAFRRQARECGLDVIALFKPLSFEGVVNRLKEAFENEAPIFAVYAKDAGWTRGGSSQANWMVAQSAWTKRWLGVSYRGREEELRLPRRSAPIRSGSYADDVRRRGRALLVHASGKVGGSRREVEVLIRPRRYGSAVSQVFVVGVERSYGHLLTPQLNIVMPDEREGDFSQLF